MNKKWHKKATKETKYEKANISADANSPINIQDEAEANLNTQTESSSLKQAFENKKQKLKAGVPKFSTEIDKKPGKM